MWQRLHDELSPAGFEIVGIALDERPNDVRPWLDGISFRVLLDPVRTFAETYAVVNVPTVIWVDADRRIVRPNEQAFADDTFRAFHGRDPELHHAALRRWVLEDVAPFDDAAVEARRPPSEPALAAARAEFRLSRRLRQLGRDRLADQHLDEAARRAPDDFTIWRAGLQLRGEDPFGPRFFEQFQQWTARTGGASYPADRFALDEQRRGGAGPAP